MTKIISGYNLKSYLKKKLLAINQVNPVEL